MTDLPLSKLTHNGTTYELKDDTARESIENLATVATSGSYNDLTDKPELANVATSGDYDDLTNKPELFSGDYNDLTNKPEIPAAQVNSDWNANSGVAEILNKPNLAAVATSGDYDDLSNKPEIPAAQVNSDWNANSGVAQILNKPELFSGDYDDLTNKPDLFSGDYNDLNNKPTIPAAQVNSDWSASSGVAQILNKPTIPSDTNDLTNGAGFITEAALTGYATESYVDTGLGGKQNNLSQEQLNAVNSGITSNDVTQIGTNQTDINAIEEKIPNQASAQNQLADKSFVNSSIATNTADFIGTFNSMEDLNGYSGTVTNNDYAFVISTDNDGNTVYNRYKYNGSSWAFEYALNNSSFTASQWTAINSGATSTNIGQISTNTASITSLQTQAGNSILTTTAQTLSAAINELDSEMPAAQVNSDWNANSGVAEILNKPTIPTTTDSVTQSSTAALTSGGAYTALAAKQDVIDASNKLSAGYVSGLANVATSGSYNDLTNTPSIPAAQVNSDWNASSGVAQILNKPNLSTVATTGAYSDLSGTPTIPTVNNATLTITQDGSTVGTFTANASSDVTIALTSGGGSSVDIDDSTITENAQNKIQAVGVVNQNTASGATTPLKLWEGSESEYNNGGNVKDTYYNWQRNSVTATNTPSNIRAYAIVYADNKFTIVNNDEDSIGAYSTDGINWTPFNMPNGGSWLALAYGNGKYVAIGTGYYSHLAYSTDGISWTRANVSSSFEEIGFKSIVYGYDKFVAVPDYSDKFAYSTDGISWTVGTLPVSLSEGSVAYGNGKYIAVGQGMTDKYVYSSDGINWTEGTLPITGNCTSICFGNGKFVVAVGSKGLYSTDGINWTQFNMPSNRAWMSILFAENKFVAVSYSDTSFIYSYDLITWYTITLASSDWRAIAYGSGKFVIVSETPSVSSCVELNTVYTTETPTTASTVYDAPDEPSTLTITSVGTGTITLSDTYTYTHINGGDAYSYYTVGETYPNLLCNIEGVGVKKGSALIADATGSVPTYTTFTGATALADGSSGLVPAPTTSDVDKYLKGDGTWASGGSVAVDESTIDFDNSDKLQALGVVNANSGAVSPLKIWTGTQAEYDVGGEVNPNITYNAWVNDTAITLPVMMIAMYPRKIYKVNDKYIGLCALYNKYVWYEERFEVSSDGTTFTVNSNQTNTANNAIYALNKYFVVGSDKIVYSTDAANWSYIDKSSILSDYESVWFNGTVLFGNDVLVVTSVGFPNGETRFDLYTSALVSSDGTNWTEYRNVLPSGYGFTAFTNFLNGMFIAQIADNETNPTHKIVTSTNGMTWTEVVGGKYPLCYGKGKYLRINVDMVNGLDYGTEGAIQYSTDLVNWTTLQTTANDIVFTGDKFAAVRKGTPDKLLISDNGINWTEYSLSTNNTYSMISYSGDDNRYYLANGDINVNNQAVGSSNALLEGYYYTLDSTPTTASTVYVEPDVTSTLTVSSVGTGTITLSDLKSYTSNSSYNEHGYYTVGESYPNLLCFIEGVGVKIGNSLFAQVNAPVDQTYDATSTNAISGVGVAEALTQQA